MIVKECSWCGSDRLSVVAKRKDEANILKCLDCGLFMLEKVPSNILQYYENENYFGCNNNEENIGYEENYDLTSFLSIYWQKSLLEIISSQFEDPSILEVGCATGNLMELLIKEEFGQGEKKGIDVSAYAVEIAKIKGLNVDIATIDKYPSNEKFDIIFSAETMEHVRELRCFIEGVQRNLKEEGVFVFYIPAINEKSILEQKNNYCAFQGNFEHLLFFTKDFLEKEFKDYFSSDVAIFEYNSDSQSYIIGFVTKDQNTISKIITIFEDINLHKINGISKNLFSKDLLNAAIISAKFYNPKMAEEILMNSREKFRSKEMYFARAIICYHKGDLYGARDNLLKSFEKKSLNFRELKILYSVEHSLLRHNENLAEERKIYYSQKIVQLEETIHQMSVSKFWKIRNYYLNIKNGRFLMEGFKTTKNAAMILFKKVAENIILIFLIPEIISNRISKTSGKNIKNPLVSIIIPCYNYGRYLEEAISSALASTYQNLEIIVIDDGPTDPFTIDLLKRLNKPKTRVIFQENQGLARARNNGITQAKGEFILPLDADDKIDPTYIEKGIYVLQKNPLRAFAYPYVRLFGAESGVWYTGEYNLNRLKKENIIPSCTLFRRKAWEISGGYNNDRHQYDDWTFWLKMGMNGFYGKLIPEILFFHRKHEGQENMTTRMRDRHEEYFRKMKADLPKLFEQNSLVTKLVFVIKDAMLWQREKYEKILPINLQTVKTKNDNKLLVFLPWTIRGGAEKVTLDVIKNLAGWDIFVVTTLKNEYDAEVDLAFKTIAKNVYHLPNYISAEDYLSFVEHLLSTQNIKTVLINHCAWAYENIEQLKTRFRDIAFFDLLHNTLEGGYKDWSKKYSQWIDKTIVISDELKQNLTRRMGFPAEKVVCILNGVDMDDAFNPDVIEENKVQKELNFPENKKIVSFIGRLSQEKNPLKFLEITRKLDQIFPGEYFFVVVGGGNLMQKATSAAKRYLRQNNFIFLGNYSHPEKLLKLSHVLVNTSEIEGMPLTVIEALAMEVPVIAPAIGAIGEIVEDNMNGFLLKKNASLEDYIEAIKKMRDEKTYSRLKENTRRSVVEKYSSMRMAKEYEHVFEEKK